jgi:hypothetical protein
MRYQTLRLPVLLLSGCAMMFGGVINFDDLPTGPGIAGSLAVTNQYQSLGVLFSNIEASKAFTFNITPTSPPNYASPFFTSLNPGLFEFVAPSTFAPAYVNSVTLTMLGLTSTGAHPGFFSGATIEALDLLGNVIPGDTQVIPAVTSTDSAFSLTFTGQVHEILFTETPGTSGLLPFDDLTFGPIQTPEPSAALLTGTALLLSGLLRRRRTRNYLAQRMP